MTRSTLLALATLLTVACVDDPSDPVFADYGHQERSDKLSPVTVTTSGDTATVCQGRRCVPGIIHAGAAGSDIDCADGADVDCPEFPVFPVGSMAMASSPTGAGGPDFGISSGADLSAAIETGDRGFLRAAFYRAPEGVALESVALIGWVDANGQPTGQVDSLLFTFENGGQAITEGPIEGDLGFPPLAR